MFVLKRNQIIISALVLMIGVAGYLNYADSRSPVNSEPLVFGEEGEIGTLVLDDTTGQEVLVVSGTSVGDGETAISLKDGESSPNGSITLKEVDGGKKNTASDVSGSAVFVNNTSDSSFFLQAKLEREQVRAAQKQDLTAMINNPNIEKDQKASCANQMLTLQQRVEKESAAEAMIEAKGFSEAYVRIDESTVDVIVSKEVLSDSELAQIEDIVKRKTGVTAENIRISAMKS